MNFFKKEWKETFFFHIIGLHLISPTPRTNTTMTVDNSKGIKQIILDHHATISTSVFLGATIEFRKVRVLVSSS